LPELDRLEALAQIRDVAPHTPLIALAARASESHALEAAAHGADDFLVKGETPPVALARAVRFAAARTRAALERLSQGEAPRPTVELVAPIQSSSMVMPVAQTRPGPFLIALAIGLFVLGVAAGILGSMASAATEQHPSPSAFAR
jgi:DNA-binding NtrC family response regulator